MIAAPPKRTHDRVATCNAILGATAEIITEKGMDGFTISEIARHADTLRYPILPCNLCGSQSDLKRVAVSDLLRQLEARIPNLRQVMLAALKNVRPSHLLDVEVTEAWLAAAPNYAPRR